MSTKILPFSGTYAYFFQLTKEEGTVKKEECAVKLGIKLKSDFSKV